MSIIPSPSPEFQEWLEQFPEDITTDTSRAVEFLKRMWAGLGAGNHFNKMAPLIILEDPVEFHSNLFRYKLVPGKFEVPECFTSIADCRGGSGQTHDVIGKGELVTLLMFDDVKLNGNNNLYDLTVGDELVHVKAGNPKGNIRAGQSKSVSFWNCVIPDQVIRKGKDKGWQGLRFMSWGLTQIKDDIPKILELGVVDEFGNSIGTIEQLCDCFDRAAREFAIGDAQGVIWYHDTGNKAYIEYVLKSSHYFYSVSDGARFNITTKESPIITSINESVEKKKKQALAFEKKRQREISKILARLTKGIKQAAKLQERSELESAREEQRNAFIDLWNSSESVGSVTLKLKMTNSQASAKASQLRKLGFKLKTFKRSKK